MITDTPLLDQLESGPWPSFVTEMKELTKKREIMDETFDGIIEEWTHVGDQIYGSLYYDAKNRFEDGTSIRTSKVLYGDLIEGGVITTKNSTYRLGVMCVN